MKLITLADLDNLSVSLHSSEAAAMAARRAAWSNMTARQRRRIARTAVREFCDWLQGRKQDGRQQYS